MADNWYVGKNGNKSGPFSPAELRDMASRGDLLPTDMVWKQGLASWVQASAIKGLFASSAAAVSRPTAGPPTNPYAPPTATELQFNPAQPRFANQAMQYADYMPRVAAALLDGLFLMLMGCVPGFGIMIVVVMLIGANEPDAADAAAALGNCCFQVVYQVVGVIYYVTLETSTKQGTWGKQIVGIKVADLNGNRITIGRAIGRYFAKIITGLTCGIGMLMPLFTEKKQTLHDLIAGCIAIKK